MGPTMPTDDRQSPTENRQGCPLITRLCIWQRHHLLPGFAEGAPSSIEAYNVSHLPNWDLQLKGVRNAHGKAQRRVGRQLESKSKA